MRVLFLLFLAVSLNTMGQISEVLYDVQTYRTNVDFHLTSLHIAAIDLDEDGIDEIVGSDLDNNVFITFVGDPYQYTLCLDFEPHKIIYSAIDSSSITSLLAGDIDETNGEDILISFDNNTLGWLKNNTMQEFSDIKYLDNIGGEYESIILVDFDLDNDQDIIYSIVGDSKVYLLENLSSGVFNQASEMIDLVDIPTDIVVDDMDEDGDNDLLYSSHENNKVAWLKNNNQSFGLPEIIIANNAINATNIFFKEMTNDNLKDVVYYISDNDIVVRSNLGNGLFGNEQIILSEKFYSTCKEKGLNWACAESDSLKRSIIIEDMDNDGDNDIIAIPLNDDDRHIISIFLNENGSFNEDNFLNFHESHNDPVRYTIGGISNQMCVGKFNSFNTNALALGYHSSSGPGFFYRDNDIRVCTYDSTMTSLVYKQINSRISGHPIISDFVDMNNNGLADIVASNAYGCEGAILLPNQGEEQFTLDSMMSISPGRMLIKIANIDSDDFGDPVTFRGDKLFWSKNLSGLGYGAAIEIGDYVLDIHNASFYIKNYIETYDIDLDGDIDVIGSRHITGGDQSNERTMVWFENINNGESWNTHLVDTIFNLMDEVFTYIDFNSDGAVDILVPNMAGNADIYVNDGDGNFSKQDFGQPVYHGVYDESQQVSPLRIMQDMDQDGDEDIFEILSAHNRYNEDVKGTVGFYENENGEFNNFLWIDTISALENQVVIPKHVFDFDNDGDLDFMATHSRNYDLYINNNNEFIGVFFRSVTTSGVSLNEFNRYGDIGVKDINSDGILDFVMPVFGRVPFIDVLLSKNEQRMQVSGLVFQDVNNDSTFDFQDVRLRGVPIVQDNGIVTYTNAGGLYTTYIVDPNVTELRATPPLELTCMGLQPFEYQLPEAGKYNIQYDPFTSPKLDFSFFFDPECVTVEGYVFYDRNENGIQDVDEDGLAGVRVDAIGNYSTVTDRYGKYNFELFVGDSVEIKVNLRSNTSIYCDSVEYEEFLTYPSNNESHNILAGSLVDPDDLRFGIYSTVDMSNLIDVSIVSLRVDQGTLIGQNFPAWMDFRTYGENTEECTLRINHDPLVSLVNSSIPITNSGDDFTEWIFSSGTAPARYCMAMTWFLDGTANIGDTLHWEGVYSCSSQTTGCSDDDNIVRDIVITNERIVEPPQPSDRITDPDFVGSLYSMRPDGYMPREITYDDNVLSYSISFENISKDKVYNLTIVDSLPNELDVATITAPFSSHNYDFRIYEPNVLIWNFENINLEHQDEMQLLSAGFTQFNIKLKDGLPEDTKISNKAYLYPNGVEGLETNKILHVLMGIPPEALCVDEVEVFLDENGTASVLPEMIDDGSTDNVSVDLLELDLENFDCDNLGSNTIELTAIDNLGNTDVCSSNVVVQDTIAPTIECEDLILMIEQGETLEITADDISINSTDACGIQSSILSKTSFTTADQGSNSITLTVTDMNGNNTTCDVNVEVTIVTDILENQFGITTSIAPNPFSNRTALQFSNELPFNYNAKLFDVTGKEVRSYMNQSSTKLLIEKQILPAGIYFLNLYESGKEEVLGSYKLVVE